VGLVDLAEGMPAECFTSDTVNEACSMRELAECFTSDTVCKVCLMRDSNRQNAIKCSIIMAAKGHMQHVS